MNYNPIIPNKLQQYIRSCTMVCCMILLFGSCIDDTYYTPSFEPGKEVEVKIFLTVPAPAIAQTRKTSSQEDDSYYNQDGLYVLIFDGNSDNSRLMQITKASGSSKIFYAKLMSTDQACYAYIVANAENIIKNNLDSWQNPDNVVTLESIKDKLQYTLETVTGENSQPMLTEMVSPQPMIAEQYLESGISATTKIGEGTNMLKMERSTVKISIYNDTDESSRAEILYGANLANAPMKGYLFSNHKALGSVERAHSGLNGNFNQPIATPAEGAKSCYLYTFESVKKENKSTSIIVQASYLGQSYYYHIRLNDETSDYALLRNCNYIVHIKRIAQKGYDSAEEALNHPAGNIEYTISVTDAYSRDIVSNGEYYLGVENTEFYALTGDTLKDRLVSVIMHNAPEGVSGRFIPGEGITISGSKEFYAERGGEQRLELRISTQQGFREGQVTVQLGDLERIIKIYKGEMPDKFGSILNSFKYKGYISGKVASKDADWLKLTAKKRTDGKDLEVNDLSEEDLFASLESADEYLCIRVKANTGDNSSPKFRYGILDLFRKDEGGNARVLIKQAVHDIYTDIIGQAQIAPYTYVGTFHRHDQMGERIIRVATTIAGGSVAKWRVFVINGDFIRLSLERSKDMNVGERNFYGDGDTSTEFGYNVEKYQVENGGTDFKQISDYIYFRVGLTSKIAANSVRYGLLGLQVNGDVDSERITRYIFVRQGEEADYLMRPQDPAVAEPGNEGKSVVMGHRDKAVKLSPFCLTDPDGKSEHSDLRGKAGVFTDYPSQAGYLYQSVNRQGWIADPSIPHAVKGFDKSNAKPMWNEDAFETCPKGYYRPDGGVESYINTNYSTDASVLQSSVRQSLWLYPKNGGVNNTQNFILGYMADGFYDRQPMWQANDGRNILKSKQPTAVNHGSKIAYMGVLTFNPSTLATIFMPITGYYSGFSGIRYSESGYNGSIWTRTRVGTEGNGGYYSVDYGFMYGADEANMTDFNTLKFRADNYKNHSPDYAQNIRCVRK